MSAAQTWDTGRLHEAVDKYCKQQWDRCRNLRKQGWNRNFDGCAERWNEDEVLRHSLYEEREKNRTSMDQAPMPTEKSGKGKGKKDAPYRKRMVGWSNARLAIEEWGGILDLYTMYDNAYDGWMTEAQFMDWVAERRQGRNTRLIICPRTGAHQRVSTRFLSRHFR